MLDRPSGVTMGPHKLCAELSRRLAAYRSNKVHALFGFLVDFPLKTDTDIREAAHRIKEIIIFRTSSWSLQMKRFILSISYHSWKVLMKQCQRPNLSLQG